MDAREIRTAAEGLTLVDERRLSHAKVGVTDIDGILRGKYMSRDKLASAFKSGFGFCDVILGWDSQDQVYDNVNYTGWHTAYPDASVRVLPETCRDIPWEDDMVFFLAEFEGAAEAICPRGILRRMVEKAAAMGYEVSAAAEYEFFLFQETPESVRAKNYRDLTPLTPGFFGYSMLRTSVHSDLHIAFLEMCELMDFPIEGYHSESGPGVLEAAIQVDNIMAAADKAVLFKTFTKIFAQRNDLMATFMAKWSTEYPGQSGHIHLSLRNQDGSSAFHEPGKEHAMSDAMRWFVGGQQTLMPELLSMVSPTVNSYTRMVPGFWAPTESNWGVENRTCALRVIPGSAKSQRCEYRVSAADANPYLAMAAALGSGLWGIENQVEPTAPVTGNAYDKTFPRRLALPRTLWEAAQKLKKSKAARALFGDAFVDHFAATREWEEREFRRHVTDWEMARYFEIV